MKSLRQKTITMLETLIAMALISILLSALFGFYSYIHTLDQKVTDASKENFRLLLFQYRLSSILPKIQESKRVGQEVEFLPFYQSFELSRPSLVFVYDHSADGDSDFSGLLLCRLYLTQEGSIHLASWPWDRNPAEGVVPMRNEVLLEGVENWKFRFYLPPRKDQAQQQIEVGTAALFNRWHLSWPATGFPQDLEPGIPAIVELLITMKPMNNEPAEIKKLSFVIPKKTEPIEYLR